MVVTMKNLSIVGLVKNVGLPFSDWKTLALFDEIVQSPFPDGLTSLHSLKSSSAEHWLSILKETKMNITINSENNLGSDKFQFMHRNLFVIYIYCWGFCA